MENAFGCTILRPFQRVFATAACFSNITINSNHGVRSDPTNGALMMVAWNLEVPLRLYLRLCIIGSGELMVSDPTRVACV